MSDGHDVRRACLPDACFQLLAPLLCDLLIILCVQRCVDGDESNDLVPEPGNPKARGG